MIPKRDKIRNIAKLNAIASMIAPVLRNSKKLYIENPRAIVSTAINFFIVLNVFSFAHGFPLNVVIKISQHVYKVKRLFRVL